MGKRGLLYSLMYCVGAADNDVEVRCDIIELEIERVRTLEWTTLFGQSNVQLKKVYIHTYVAQTSSCYRPILCGPAAQRFPFK